MVFNEKKVVGFRNELTEQKRDFFFDVTFEDEHETGESPNFVTKDIREENPETKINAEVLSDEETSLGSETENQIDFKTTVNINSKMKLGQIIMLKALESLLQLPRSKQQLCFRKVPLDQNHRDFRNILFYGTDLIKLVMFSKHHESTDRK